MSDYVDRILGALELVDLPEGGLYVQSGIECRETEHGIWRFADTMGDTEDLEAAFLEVLDGVSINGRECKDLMIYTGAGNEQDPVCFPLILM